MHSSTKRRTAAAPRKNRPAAAPGGAMFLSPAEIAELTKRCRFSAQRRALIALGVSFRVRADGSLVVARAHVEAILGVGENTPPQQQEQEPNWEAMR